MFEARGEACGSCDPALRVEDRIEGEAAEAAASLGQSLVSRVVGALGIVRRRETYSGEG